MESSLLEGSPLVAASSGYPVVASLFAEHRLQSSQSSSDQHVGAVVSVPRFSGACSRVVAHRLSCSMACRIFPDQGLNSHLLRWQADSSPLSHQRSPDSNINRKKNNSQYLCQVLL